MSTNAAELEECMKMIETNDPVSKKEGFLKCRALADNGNSDAQTLMAKLLRTTHIEDIGMETDELAAFDYLSKAHAAGNLNATNQLSEMYYNRDDYIHAFPLAKLAADAGIAEAMSLVGNMYELGVGVEKDLLQSSSYFKRGHDAGNDFSSTMYANHLADGYIGSPNPEKAIEILEGLFIKYPFPDQAYKLYQLYLSTGNIDKSDQWLIKAAELGNDGAIQEVNKRSLNDHLVLVVEGKSIVFQLATGNVVEAIRERRTSVNGFKGNVNTTTNYWYEFKFKTEDGKSFKAIPDNDIPIEVGSKCTLLSVGYKGSGTVTAYKLAVKATSKTFKIMELSRVVKLPKTLSWWLVSIFSIVLGVYFSGILVLIGIALGALLITIDSKSNRILRAVEKRSIEILEKDQLLR